MLIYLHGYGSSGKGDTAKELKKLHPSMVCPSYNPHKVFDSITDILYAIDCADDDEEVTIVASSLGGWYAEKIASMRTVNLILYNPSLCPEKSLAKYGVNDHVLRDYGILTPKLNKSIVRYVVLSEDDDVVPCGNAMSTYEGIPGVKCVMTDGGHRMTDKNLKTINKIINICATTK